MTSSSLRRGGKLLRGVKGGDDLGLNLRREKKKAEKRCGAVDLGGSGCERARRCT